jgi:HK97 gp10 family phage protein
MATKVQGVDQLKRKLRAMPDAARREISRAMEQSAQEIVDLARSLVPVDQGDLRDSIGWSWHGLPQGSVELGSVRAQGRGAGNLAIVIYAGNEAVFWARWQEFGTRNHPASPYFFVSYRAMRKRVRGRVQRAIRNAAKRAAVTGGSGVA